MLISACYCQSYQHQCVALQASAGLTDILPQLLPAEQGTKTSPQKGAATVEGVPKTAADKDSKQLPGTSATAKATTPKRQDQVTTKSAGARASGKGRQDRDRGQQSATRPRQVGCLAALPI